ncbi:THUMP domain-containing protein 1 [Nymphaea thermarum]|nr:THUMP domain-containing protein 1 [Nymphaea thermarum]
MADAGQVGDKANGKSKKRKPRYLPHNRPVKKGLYPLRPGVEGFFLTCDGGRERQATREALALVDRFFEELVDGKGSDEKSSTITSKPLNKKILFNDSDSSGSDEEPESHEEEENIENHNEDTDEKRAKKQRLDGDMKKGDTTALPDESERVDAGREKDDTAQHLETDTKGDDTAEGVDADRKKDDSTESNKTEQKSTDEQQEDEFAELYDRSKRRFASLDSGCNGIIFVRMNKSSGDPGPTKIVEHLMTTAASTRKHMSRFILRLLPVELTCYASEEEISEAIKPLVSQHFPADGASQKFAVLYDARANTGIERSKIIDVVAKSVPKPHKVDLSNPDKTIVVQIVKTVCLIGVVERYKELAKYNLRQLTSSKA